MGIIEDYMRLNMFPDEEAAFNDRFIAFLARNFIGQGDPEGVVTAPPGSAFWNTNGGISTTLYVKETGTGNTGWVAYGVAGGGGGLTTEQVQDIVGAMITGNTETGIAVTYDDTNALLNFVAEVTQTELDDVITDVTDLDTRLTSIEDGGQAELIESTPFDDITATDVQAALEQINDKTSITRPFDDLRVAIQFVDDFIAPNTIATRIGDGGWVGVENNGGAISAGVTNFLGSWTRLSTGNTSATGGAEIGRSTSTILAGLVSVMEARIHVGPSSAAQSYRVIFGWNDPLAAGNTALFKCLFEASNTGEIQTVTSNSGGTETQGTGVNWVGGASSSASTIRLLRIEHDGAGNWLFYVDDVLETTHSTTVPSALAPVIAYVRCEKVTGSTTARLLELDWVVGRIETART